MGGTPACPRDFNNLPTVLDAFVFDTCHWHWHYEGYATYVLEQLDDAGEVVKEISGRKTGFCLIVRWDMMKCMPY